MSDYRYEKEIVELVDLNLKVLRDKKLSGKAKWKLLRKITSLKDDLVIYV